MRVAQANQIKQSVKLLASQGQTQPAFDNATGPHLQVPRAQRSDGPPERLAPTRPQGNFLWLLSFLPEKKVTPRRAGAPNFKPQKKQTKALKKNTAIKPPALVVTRPEFMKIMPTSHTPQAPTAIFFIAKH
jgi:hypothetical protein